MGEKGVGKAIKILLFGSLSLIGSLIALAIVGSNVKDEFDAHSPVAQDLLARAPVAAEPSTPASLPSERRGINLLEQAIFDAFPEKAPRSEDERRNVANAADYVGFTINAQGHLCAKVIEMQQASTGQYGVGCVKHRSGVGRANYLVDVRTGSVDEI